MEKPFSYQHQVPTVGMRVRTEQEEQQGCMLENKSWMMLT